MHISNQCVSDWLVSLLNKRRDGAQIFHTYIFIAQLKRPKLAAAITAIQPNRDISIFRLL